MIQVQVTGTDALTRRLLELGADAPKAQARAINRTLRSVNVAVIRDLAANLGLTQGVVRGLAFRGKPAIGTERATYTRPVGVLTTSGQRLPLILFGARQTRVGVTHRLGGRGTIPSGFIATMRSGHTGVYRREAAQGPMPLRRRGGRRPAAAGLLVSRTPISERFGPSLPHVMRTTLMAPTVAAARATFEKNLEHEIRFILSQRVPPGDE